jgi:hypothetical protein
VQRWLRRDLARVAPLGHDDHVRGADGVEVVGRGADQATALQHGFRLTGDHPHVDAGQRVVVQAHLEHAEAERDHAQRHAVEHHDDEPFLSCLHARIVT